ncbi:MAG: winged helix-turn-helix domain-containing protein [Chloroflexota bacterium]|nr:winged helix-turn-helix domain-containing protein [Chloroflexota bacterium]
MLRQMGGPGSSRPGVAAFLLAEMHEKLVSPCTFIIDDWQFVASVTEVRGLWNQILRDAPSTCRFVFASRGKPQLQFARFKTHGGYAELRTDDLRITGPEITELFRDVYRNPLTPDEAAELERRTEGWAASLQLVDVSMRGRRTPEERRALIDSLTARSDSDLFAFLAEEVLDQQSEETRNFLLSTSILQQITPEVAERLAGVHDGMHRLLQLEHAGLFTERLDESRYRYHGLFREFLERRLAEERSDAEVMGLHIHAASYFETSSQWPEAIYHYLRAGLQRQAARLIARYGEDVVAEGRLGLVDEWLQQLPAKTIHDNARLSLLHGEARGISGDWVVALEALERGRNFFESKGDRRMQALALIKLGTLFSHWGDPVRGSQAASEALALAPPEARDLRLRAEGNLVLTRQWLEEPLAETQRSLMRLTAEALQLGFDHYAALGFHNLGQLQLEMGNLDHSLKSLERAAAFWGQATRSPFADNSILVTALLIHGEKERADYFAKRGMVATAGWPRIHAEASTGMARVHMAMGRFGDAKDVLATYANSAIDLGASSEMVLIHHVEAKLLSREFDAELSVVVDQLTGRRLDPRLAPTTLATLAAAEHALGRCGDRCGVDAWDTARGWANRGGAFAAADAIVRVGPVLLDHSRAGAGTAVSKALAEATRIGSIWYHRHWLRMLAPFARSIAQESGGMVLAALVDADPGAWAGPIITDVLPSLDSNDREIVLRTIERRSDPTIIPLLANIGPASDIAQLRSRLVARHATRLYIATFGKLLVHRGGWKGPAVEITKKRERLLLSFLVAHFGQSLSREQVLDALWPEAPPSAAVNNLNQTVFQLRRQFDRSYRDGQSPQYVVSTLEAVGLNPDLVKVDSFEIERRFEGLSGSSLPDDSFVRFLLQSLRGQFLQECLYEDWATQPRQRMHRALRTSLMPAALARDLPPDNRVGLAACLVALDDFDEAAHIAMARALADSGRRIAGEQLLRGLIRRIEHEFSEPAPPELASAIAHLQGETLVT